ncbi:hypothetical protein O181_066611 [Austropuccinia psidii MF-1]|uniref:Uncharacterized protein n=1 Tax=Austropuccinia psidii MF-1 TaxID=1389203 RepID=A0A9Q3EY07_9BASI|nr:hypothetical protein [Austropuccinia psidii MF-1]
MDALDVSQIIQVKTQQAIVLLTQTETKQNTLFHGPSNDDYNHVTDSLHPPYTTHPSFSTQNRTKQLYNDPSPQNNMPLNTSFSIHSSSHSLFPNLSCSTNSNSHCLGPNLSSSTNSNSHCLGPNLSSSTNSNTHHLNPNLSSDHHVTKPTSLAHLGILLCTDLVARGSNLPKVDVVIQFG